MKRKVVHQKHTAVIGNSTEWVFQFWAWQLLAWSLYRYFFRLPEPVDEFLVKPVVFILPVLWFVLKKEKRGIGTIGITSKNLLQSILIGCGFGFLFGGEAILANVFKYGSLTLTPTTAILLYGLPMMFILSLVTSISEELLSRGFFFSRLYETSKNLIHAVVMSTLLFVAFHIPILLTSLRFQGTTLILFFMTSIVLGIANSLIYYRTKSLVAPILVHFFWNMTVAVFL
jgi:membrane protease YdiL (CAAX protease family)